MSIQQYQLSGKIFLSITTILLLGSLHSQTALEPEYIDIHDCYVIQATVNDSIIEDRCACGVHNFAKKTCVLYQISVDSILLMRDTSLYNLDELKNVSYILVEKGKQILLGEQYLFFLSNSSSKFYLVTNSMYANPKTQYEYANTMPYFSGLVDCSELNFWDKVQIFFGGNRESILIKRKKIFDGKNKFLAVIK